MKKGFTHFLCFLCWTNCAHGSTITSRATDGDARLLSAPTLQNSISKARAIAVSERADRNEIPTFAEALVQTDFQTLPPTSSTQNTSGGTFAEVRSERSQNHHNSVAR